MKTAKVLENKYVQSTAKYVLAVTGLGLVALGVSQAKRLVTKGHNKHIKASLLAYLSEDQFESLATDEDYLDIAYRFIEFSGLTPLFKTLLLCMYEVVNYKQNLPKSLKHHHVKTFATKGHSLIASVRMMRAYLELKMPSILEDFDEVAADVQTKYEEDHEHLLYDVQMSY